jgi:hypothetical protein
MFHSAFTESSVSLVLRQEGPDSNEQPSSAQGYQFAHSIDRNSASKKIQSLQDNIVEEEQAAQEAIAAHNRCAAQTKPGKDSLEVT